MRVTDSQEALVRVLAELEKQRRKNERLRDQRFKWEDRALKAEAELERLRQEVETWRFNFNEAQAAKERRPLP